MKKSDRITALVGSLGAAETARDPHYAGYFTCFNARRYYEAHDVLEQLWLRTEGRDYRFFKGLIQLAGAFVHLQKQREQPSHPKHASRMRPAVRLFRLAVRNLEEFAPRYLDLDVAAVLRLAASAETAIVASDYTRNPWHPAEAPQLHLAPQ